jgi:hypothetical protein
LFQKRDYKVLLRAMRGKPFVHKLRPTAQERNFPQAIGLIKQVRELKMKVHGLIYTSIVDMITSNAEQ